MTEENTLTKAQVLTDNERAWNALNTALDRLTESQMTTIRDKEGWTVKDHLIHLTYWERSVTYLLQGKPRHEGLGVEESTYVNGDFDGINAEIQAKHNAIPLGEARAQLTKTHQDLTALVEQLTEADLHKPYSAYLPHEGGRNANRVVIEVLYGNTTEHFEEHQEWIESLVNK